MRKIAATVATVGLLFGLTLPVSQAHADQAIHLVVDGRGIESDVPPYLDTEHSRVLVPVRALAESLGAKVAWDGAHNVVLINSALAPEGVEGKAAAPAIVVNGKLVPTDVPAAVVNGRTFLPARAVAEALQSQVNWDERTSSVVILSGPLSQVKSGLEQTATVVAEMQKAFAAADGAAVTTGQERLQQVWASYAAALYGYDAITFTWLRATLSALVAPELTQAQNAQAGAAAGRQTDEALDQVLASLTPQALTARAGALQMRGQVRTLRSAAAAGDAEGAARQAGALGEAWAAIADFVRTQNEPLFKDVDRLVSAVAAGTKAAGAGGMGLVEQAMQLDDLLLKVAPKQVKQWAGAPAMQIDPEKVYTATITTTKGDIQVELFAKAAPQTVNNFIFLAKQGFYEDIIFHRVISDFMIQTGDPSGTGSGGPGYAFADELPPAQPYAPGIVAMANAGPNTNGSQFFICSGDACSNLNHFPNYTVFGRVTAGMDVVKQIASVPTVMTEYGEQSRPKEPPRILSVTVK